MLCLSFFVPAKLGSLEKTSVDTLVVCPKDFQTAMRPWLRLRQAQGHQILVVAPLKSAYETRKLVHRLARERGVKNLLLVGDSHPSESDKSVPTDYVRARVNSYYGSEPEIASDNAYSDLNNDGVPELTVGRLAVDDVAQLETVIKKIIRYERELDFGRWRRRINLVAGTGGFGAFEDRIIERTTKHFITELIPPIYNTSMTYASWSSVFCPDPRKLAATTIRRLNEGCLFWVYIGHGHYCTLDQMRVGNHGYRILDRGLVKHVKSQSGLPIAIFLACYTGGFDFSQDCLAEQLLCQKQGPVACICGTRVTMPYAMGVLSLELMDEYFHGRPKTLGELILAAKRNMMEKPDPEDRYRQMIELLGKTLSPTGNLLELERREHLHMIHLLGDPLLRLQRIKDLPLSLETSPVAGAKATLRGRAPQSGELTVELTYRRDRLRIRPPRRKEFDPSHQNLASYQSTYEQANRRICASKKIKVEPGSFSVEIDIPEKASGDCYFRAYLSTERQAYAGSIPVNLK